MTTRPLIKISQTTFASKEWDALCTLRHQYRQYRDLFSAGERAHLRFLRWLYQTGRLVS